MVIVNSDCKFPLANPNITCARTPYTMAKPPKNAISPTRAEDYPEWYQQVVKAGELAENSAVRG